GGAYQSIVWLERTDQKLPEPFKRALRAERVRNSAKGVAVASTMPSRPRVAQVRRTGREDEPRGWVRVEFLGKCLVGHQAKVSGALAVFGLPCEIPGKRIGT